jgi:uncharacterized protein
MVRHRKEATMLELRPLCEHCAKALPPDCAEARICSFECTFCSTCAHDLLEDICPNCGGNFVPRPIRLRHNWKGDNFPGKYPASRQPKHRPADLVSHAGFAARMNLIAPADR